MFDWHKYIEFADDLFAGNGFRTDLEREVMFRNCVSRAYYGTYCQTRNFCARKGIFFATGRVEDHAKLIEACKEHQNFDVKHIGKHLEWLRSRRNDCDYLDDISQSHLIKDLETRL